LRLSSSASASLALPLSPGASPLRALSLALGTSPTRSAPFLFRHCHSPMRNQGALLNMVSAVPGDFPGFRSNGSMQRPAFLAESIACHLGRNRHTMRHMARSRNTRDAFACDQPGSICHCGAENPTRPISPRRPMRGFLVNQRLPASPETSPFCEAAQRFFGVPSEAVIRHAF